ncbi:F-box protein At2g32560 [Elaeis guineensis]|uniref:F-box protein At2g32560 n=1 Tax=Elaeis guineensis var. tenera TaxID=51953 RepID=A0A6I9R7K3_ELAGV|nr:F-box protein At2g32560 [Elaeis guineensis]
MFFVLVSFLSCLLLITKSLPLKPLPPWVDEMRLLSVLFWQEFVYYSLHWLKNCQLTSRKVFRFPFTMSTKKLVPRGEENVEETSGMTILDLPELALECILGKLSPAGLANMACVCSSLRDRCRSDHLWERHMREKWGRVIGRPARREWEWYISSRKGSLVSGGAMASLKRKGWMGSISCVWPLSWLKCKLDDGKRPSSPLPMDSMMSWYLVLESGKFWFPAQVYNRENGHVGFLLSCYDAELSYDRHADTFYARYPPHGRRPVNIEEGVEWDRLRAPPVDTPAHDLHVSDCLNDLCPGDHIEIQWRRNKEFPYGWWYGVVGHLDLCDGNENHCRCHKSDTIILEFNQYTHGSRWRRAAVRRKDHQEEGNETNGFYGGIRKLHSKDEIAMWRRLWPNEILE